jgi:cysteine/O-acetylserine efflux protein
MTSTIISAFLTFTFITAMTPGPNNILALSTASQYGLRRSGGTLAGMCMGFLAVMLICAAFTLTLINLLPAITVWLTWIGAAYILWLALRIANSSPSASNSISEPISFWASFGLQFVNVKIIFYGITALSTFVLPYNQSMPVVMSVSILLAIIGSVGNVCWAMAGHVFQATFQRFGKIINVILAMMLVYCAIRMFV